MNGRRRNTNRKIAIRRKFKTEFRASIFSCINRRIIFKSAHRDKSTANSKKGRSKFLNDNKRRDSPGDYSVIFAHMIRSKQFATNSNTFDLLIQIKLGNKAIDSRSLLLNRVKKSAIAPGNNGKRNARNTAAGPDIAKETISKVKFMENG